MDKLTTQELYAQLQDRIVVDLKEDEIACPECKGLRFVYVQKDDTGYIETCRHCYTGKLFVCKHCGKTNKTDYCNCREAKEESDIKFHSKQAKENFKNYQRAEKINYKDYTGYYLINGDEHLKTQDDLEEWIYEQLSDGEDVPEYLWAVEKGISTVYIGDVTGIEISSNKGKNVNQKLNQ